MSVAFRRESDEEHKEPRFELPLARGPNVVTPRGLRLIEARVAALAGAESDEAKREARYWSTRRATAQVAPEPPLDTVAVRSRVTILLNGSERAIDIVGHDEGDAVAGRVPFAAPLGAALIGAEVGERIDWGGKPSAIEVLAIAAIPPEEN
jgi:transcription elongation GreA/GreB family factor